MKRPLTVSYSFSVSMDVTVMAESLDEAMGLVERGEVEEPPRDEWEYVDGSFEIHRDWSRQLNEGQKLRIIAIKNGRRT